MKMIQTVSAVFAFLLVSLMATEVKAEVALDGYCPVCYLAANKAVEGSSKFSAAYQGKTYHFVSTETRDLFRSEPDKYLPQYDGYCAFGMAYGKKIQSDPTVFTVRGGKVYLNKDKATGKKFEKDLQGLIKKADVQWMGLTHK